MLRNFSGLWLLPGDIIGMCRHPWRRYHFLARQRPPDMRSRGLVRS